MRKVDLAVVVALRADLDAALRDIRYLSLIALQHRRLLSLIEYTAHAADFNWTPDARFPRRDGKPAPTTRFYARREPAADFAYVAPKIMAELEIATGGDL